VFSLEAYLSKKTSQSASGSAANVTGRLSPFRRRAHRQSWVVWVAVTRLRLVVRALELVLLTAPTRLILQLFTRLILQLFAFLTARALLLLATLAALLLSLITFLSHQITPCCQYLKTTLRGGQAFLPLTEPRYRAAPVGADCVVLGPVAVGDLWVP